MSVPGIIVAGASSGTGKTTFTAGLNMALRSKGLIPQPFKVGPDFIDPSYHTLAAGRSCRNLDGHLTSPDLVPWLFRKSCAGADIAVVEGVMGLYDGLGPQGDYSSAWTAHRLGLPVILLVDARASSISVAATVYGFSRLPGLAPEIAGVILNNVGGESHADTVRQAVEERTGIPVLGWLPKIPQAGFPSRHLGLVPAAERGELIVQLDRIAQTILQYVDVDRIVNIARPGRRFSFEPDLPDRVGEGIRIGIARDEVFTFYYQDALDLLTELGAELVPFSPLHDCGLPEGLGGIFLGGGYPEEFLEGLSENRPFLEKLRAFHRDGKPIYAECGGMMYLAQTMASRQGECRPMAGILDMDVTMTDRLQRFGYVEAEVLADTILQEAGWSVRGHEFHYSQASGEAPEGYRVRRTSRPLVSWSEGYLRSNLLASYVHLHFWNNPRMAARFLQHAVSPPR